jgi:tRNA (guanine37-N1)-methyltransferase
MEIDVLTLFPRVFTGPVEESILKRAQESGRVQIRVHDLREFTHDKHRVVDDRPYGGGPGMLLKPEPIFEAVEKLRRADSCVVLMTPQGVPFTQARAQQFARQSHLIILCGHYEGVDERVRQALVHEEISIGDYVLTNGALAAAVVVDAVVRLVPGVLGHEQGAADDSFASGLLEGPQYTRPPVFRGMEVPAVLLSGDHEAIARWRAEQARERTAQRRPDLLGRGDSPGRPRRSEGAKHECD